MQTIDSALFTPPHLVPLPIENASTLENLSQPPMLVESIIPAGSITLLAGPTYSAKTFFAMELARAVAFGAPFLHHFPVASQGNVLFIEQDSPKYDTGRALWSLLRPQMENLQEVTPEGRHDLDALSLVWHPGLNLKNQLDVARIIATASSLFTSQGIDQDSAEEVGFKGCALIIFDTFRDLHTADENSSTEMSAILQQIKYIRKETGAAILLIHHVPHLAVPGSTGVRGSTAIEGAVDTILKIKGDRKTATFVVTVLKARAIQPPNFRFQVTTETTPEHGTFKKVVFFGPTIDDDAPPPENQFLSHLMHRPDGLTQSDVLEWATLNNLSLRTVQRWIATLVSRKLLRKERYAENQKSMIRIFSIDTLTPGTP